MFPPVNTDTRRFALTRIAPTPSGFLHVGNILSFSLSALSAERFGARVLLRIDDLDRERVRPEYVQDIFDTLRFMDIPWHEGPRDAEEFEREFSQLRRLEMYREALDGLRRKGLMFACDCSRSLLQNTRPAGVYPGTCLAKNLPLDTPETNWRLDNRGSEPIGVKSLDDFSYHDLPDNQRFCVLRKKDGFPAYQLTSVLDDVHFGVDFVVRGADLWTSTLAQLRLAQSAGLPSFRNVTFFHHGLLNGADGDKLSKSAGATSVQYLRKSGYSRADIYGLIGKWLNLPHPVRHRDDLASLLKF